jgi:predicted PurR-regulated permease PerM
LLAVLAGVFELIPLFGAFLAAVPGIAIASVDGGITLGLMVTGLYLIISQFENHLIYPLVVTKVVGVPPLMVIIALIVGFQTAGFLGVILSVPVAAIVQELIKDVQKEKATFLKKHPQKTSIEGNG